MTAFPPKFITIYIHIYQAEHTDEHTVLDKTAHISSSTEAKIPQDDGTNIRLDGIERRSVDDVQQSPARGVHDASRGVVCLNRDRAISVGVYPTHALVWKKHCVFFGARVFIKHDYAAFVSLALATCKKRELEARNDVSVVIMYSLKRQDDLTYYVRMPIDTKKLGWSCDKILSKRRKWKRQRHHTQSVFAPPKKNKRVKKRFTSWHHNAAFRVHVTNRFFSN